MSDARKAEIERNYDYFQRNLKKFLKHHRGEYALLRDEQVIDWFEGPGEAYRTGLSQFSDELFSIQEADDRPVEIGLVSLAFD